ncbi:hypothetical protein AXK56_11595 [Tsukamurella pulmonis]|nr:hypothetical protein AXK56_11595 [Tsukamurella pulmonis]
MCDEHPEWWICFIREESVAYMWAVDDCPARLSLDRSEQVIEHDERQPGPAAKVGHAHDINRLPWVARRVLLEDSLDVRSRT